MMLVSCLPGVRMEGPEAEEQSPWWWGANRVQAGWVLGAKSAPLPFPTTERVSSEPGATPPCPPNHPIYCSDPECKGAMLWKSFLKC